MRMTITHKERWRATVAICQALAAFDERRQTRVLPATTRFLEDVSRLAPLLRRLGHCVRRGWRGAALRVRRDFVHRVQGLAIHVQELRRLDEVRSVAVPTPRDVYRDLAQCEHEFSDLRVQEEEGLLCVTTEPIELEGVYLGDFSIRLHVPSLHALGMESAYYIVARDPHPAVTNSAVTHPHVSDERLCAGDASAAIHAALAQGRICDFFLLVRSVLTHYNPASPYVALTEWTGMPCYDCGEVLSEDQVFGCANCERDFCGGCASYCRVCQEITCHECLTDCPVCDELTCPACLIVCPACGEPICQACQTDRRCPCLETETEDQDDQTKKDREQAPSQSKTEDTTIPIR
jgi:hypothetical protein